MPAAKDRAQPERQCVVSRRRAPRGALLRLQLGPEGRPYIDILGRAPGRGVYVAPDALTEALTPKGLRRVFRGKARSLEPSEVETLVAGTAERLTARIEELLGLARRSGGIAVGMEATSRRLDARPEGVVVVLAGDLAARSEERVRELLASKPHVKMIRASTRARIGSALGRETVGVTAVWHPVFARRLVMEAERLAALTASRETGGSREQTGKND